MKNPFYLFLTAFCIFSQACQRPVAYFQRTPHVSARVPLPTPATISADTVAVAQTSAPDTLPADVALVASVAPRYVADPIAERVARRTQRIQSQLSTPAPVSTQVIDYQPKPKPKKQLRLGNRIRESLGIPLREELNWWQRISWKLKAAFVLILIAVVFALLKITLLAIIFGVVGAFLLISGLRRSFKTRRPWF